MERVRVLYSGRVQGVGFRYTTRQIADGLAVAGTVRNLADGRVELLAEGEPAVLERLLAAVRAEFGPQIHDCDRQVEGRASGPLSGFTVLP